LLSSPYDYDDINWFYTLNKNAIDSLTECLGVSEDLITWKLYQFSEAKNCA
jgi:hypothetical protein